MVIWVYKDEKIQQSHLAGLNLVNPPGDVSIVHKKRVLLQIFNVGLDARLEFREGQEVDRLDLFRLLRVFFLFPVTNQVACRHYTLNVP